MNLRILLLSIFITAIGFTSCKEDIDQEQIPVVKMLIEGTALNGRINEKIAFAAAATTNVAFEQEWKLDEEVKSTSATYDFTPLKSGIYKIEYIAKNSAGSARHQYIVNVGIPTVPANANSNNYVTTLFEYTPAPGQNTNKTLGSVAAAKGLEGKQGMVSLGAWGGYVVYGFDHTVINETEKDDLIVYGNPQANFAEPAIVWVMRDENGNRKPDDIWYELKGSEYGKNGYERDYEVTYIKPATGGAVSWKDNRGKTGTVNISSATFQSFSAWIEGAEYTLKGSLLPTTGIKPGGLITSMPFNFGYADNLVGGDKLDIANAIDKDGKSISLGGIDFVKIQTGIQANLGILGELSTEVVGVADLNLVR